MTKYVDYDEYDDRIVEHNGKTWKTDYEGYLIDVGPLEIKLDEDWYDYVRIKDGIPELTSEHIEIIEFYQDYYKNNGLWPIKRILTKGLNKSFDTICKLFPSKNPLKTIHMMAGLPRPHGYR
jgi:tRNA 2-thiouridine synthesizing protein E